MNAPTLISLGFSWKGKGLDIFSTGFKWGKMAVNFPPSSSRKSPEIRGLDSLLDIPVVELSKREAQADIPWRQTTRERFLAGKKSAEFTTTQDVCVEGEGRWVGCFAIWMALSSPPRPRDLWVFSRCPELGLEDRVPALHCEFKVMKESKIYFHILPSNYTTAQLLSQQYVSRSLQMVTNISLNGLGHCIKYWHLSYSGR